MSQQPAFSAILCRDSHSSSMVRLQSGPFFILRDWSLIMGKGGGGATKDRVKLFMPLPLLCIAFPT